MDGEIVAAIEEERFTRTKHDSSFPGHAIDECLTMAGLTADQLDHVGFYDKPYLKFDRLVETHLAYAPRSFAAFPPWAGSSPAKRRARSTACAFATASKDRIDRSR